jgi:hypothetical protein
MTFPSERTGSTKPTIEELLRLKRAERPSGEFWTEFERDLRTKQLAAIIEKRPWWVALRLPQAARQLARYQLPVGAAAVLALGFVVIRNDRPMEAPAFEPSHSVVVVSEPVKSESVLPKRIARAEVAVATVNTTEPGDSQAMPTPAAKEPDLSEQRIEPVRVASAAVASEDESLMSMIPWAAPRPVEASADTRTSLPIGELPQVHFASAVAPGRDHDFGGRVELASLVVSQPPVPVQESDTATDNAVTVSPREVRRSRILTTLAATEVASSEAEPSRLGRIREILVSSLDDDHLYDSVRRVGMGGDRFTVKF